MKLADGDTGIQALTQLQVSASMSTNIAFVIGHPIAWIPAYTKFFASPANLLAGPIPTQVVLQDAALAILRAASHRVTTITGTIVLLER